MLSQRLRELAERLEQGATVSPPLQQALINLVEQILTEPAAPVSKPRRKGAASGGPIHIWCDGSCSPNPGPGGWGSIVEQDGRREELSGAAAHSTNNIMEMTAALEALKHTPPGASAVVVTDSRYVVDGMSQWLAGWKRNGWRKADKKPVLNRELWQALDEAASQREVAWQWVEGHAGHPENERCDELANQARLALRR